MNPLKTVISEVKRPLYSRSDRDTSRTAEPKKVKIESPKMRTPTYIPAGYPNLGNLWMEAPKPLPGPDDHPFFTWVAQGAIKDPSVSISDPKDEAATPRLAPLAILAPQPVHPFVPIPTLIMEPITPTLLKSTVASSRPLSNSPSDTLPDLSSSPTEPSPHSPIPAATESSTSSPDEAREGKPHDADPAAHYTQALDSHSPHCTLTYMRRLPDPVASAPIAIRNGQVWSSKANGWRRHQWSNDVPDLG